MRIIGGTHGGLRLHPPTSLPVRPTTDLAKEALFNILQHQLDFTDLHALDLFAGTGNITFELASRGAMDVTAVDIHFKCVQYIAATAKKIQLPGIRAIKADVLRFLVKCEDTFDFIFIDPPYDLPQLPQLPQLVLERNLLREQGLLILEHPSTRQIPAHPALSDTRKYGYSSFSFYKK
ncbi:16S rRNA (guanine(966)-N(2))-methyltransferase RsmD [Parapedobacter lycopersici]|uniref:16S rRNA (guanine(966)-N(2))-methyltransferase RsmD n=1 Tax=Parapedobacter lycopersici TaxID=1864939 RepID=UPI00214D89B4|nr:16S rRNA (guanine(966)-N(2))-methyltransferase RsmD [Parapedobacter lycopersici]